MNQKQFKFSLWYFVIALGAMLFFNILLRAPEQTIEFSEFKSKVVSGEIKRVELGESYFIGLPHTGAELKEMARKRGRIDSMPPHYRAVPVSDPSFIELMDQNGVEYYVRPVTFGESVFRTLISWVVPILILVLVWRFLMPKMGGMGGGVMSFGKNRAQILAEGDTGVTFDDVAGIDEAKEELQETIDFLKNPGRYEVIGGKLPKGVLLVGPPGTGKTMLAKAVAGEARVPFFKISGSEFVEMFVGVGAARVRDLFKQAKEKAPCIVFIDELDAIGKSRGVTMMAHDEREQTLNQLLVEMDGFDSKGGVIILAATNRPEVLDPALLRPGRFDRQVLVDRPDLLGREAILQVHARDVRLDDSIDLKKVAQSTAGFTGADLANLVNEAAILAVRRNRDKVLQNDFDEAIERLIVGLEKKNRLINPKEKEIVAYHETGHALVAAFTPGVDPVHKISIVPRGLGALGYTMQTPTSDRFLITEKEILGKIDVLLGGRAAESIIFGQVSSGAANDLSQATEIARTMIMDYGMSKKFRNVVLSSRQPTILDRGGLMPPAHMREHSESTQQYIDETIAEIIDQRYELAVSLLKGKKNLLQIVASKLLELETMDASQFQALIKEYKNEQL